MQMNKFARQAAAPDRLKTPRVATHWRGSIGREIVAFVAEPAEGFTEANR
jgi:hypothetical protein